MSQPDELRGLHDDPYPDEAERPWLDKEREKFSPSFNAWLNEEWRKSRPGCAGVITPCPACGGNGCHICHWSGEIRRSTARQMNEGEVLV